MTANIPMDIFTAAKQDEYREKRAGMIENILEDVAMNDTHVQHLIGVMAGKCPNCHTCHEGRFTRNAVESRYATLEFVSNTRSVEYDVQDDVPGDSDFVTGFDCATCGHPVSQETLEHILWLTDDELYTVRKARSWKALEDERDTAKRRAENHKSFLGADHITKIEHVKIGMPCRLWSVKHGDYVTGIVADLSDGIVIVSDRGELFSRNDIRDVWFGATMETIGGHTLMHRVSGDWVIFRAEGPVLGDTVTDDQAYPSREAAILSAASDLI